MASALKNLSEIEGFVPSGENATIVIVVSEWNSNITSELLKGAVNELIKHSTPENKIIVETVPGCFELPFGAQTASDKYCPDAVICLGCVIRGETPHFEYISQAASNGIMQVALATGIPVIFGVLTVDTLEQALDRSGGKHGNKGVEAAVAALKMIKRQ